MKPAADKPASLSVATRLALSFALVLAMMLVLTAALAMQAW